MQGSHDCVMGGVLNVGNRALATKLVVSAQKTHRIAKTTRSNLTKSKTVSAIGLSRSTMQMKGGFTFARQVTVALVEPLWNLKQRHTRRKQARVILNHRPTAVRQRLAQPCYLNHDHTS